MVTGDNLLTARAIAIECGIVDPNNADSLVMNGQDFIQQIGGGLFIYVVVCSVCKTKTCDCPINEDQSKQLKKPVYIIF